MLSKISFIFLIIIGFAQAGNNPADKARGLFVSFGVGPRIPIGYFSNSTELGYGFNIGIDYTDNEYLPLFLFAKFGYEQYTGSQDFYRTTAYSNLSTTSIPVNLGVRYYFAPLAENVVLFMPFVELSGAFNYYSKLHQFKSNSGRTNYTEEISKIGINGGAGISMFMMEILATYNYFETNQFISVDLKIRLPLYIVF